MPFGLKYCHTSRSQVLICIHSILLFILLFSAFWSYFISCILQLYWLFLESLWTIKNTFSDYKSKCAFCETNGNCRKYKEEKKKQALLILHSKDNCYCTSTVLQLYNCFVLYLPVFLFFVKHFWYNISILYVAYLKKHYYSGHELHLPLVFKAINGSKFIFLVRPHTSIQNAHACIYTEVHTLFFENWHRVSYYKLKSYKFCDYVDCVVRSLVWLASSIVGQDE